MLMKITTLLILLSLISCGTDEQTKRGFICIGNCAPIEGGKIDVQQGMAKDPNTVISAGQ